MIYILAFLVVLPQIVFLPFKLSFLLLWLFLVLLARLSKSLFALFILLLSVINIAQVHVSLHWGGDLLSRMAVALQSPHYETMEYLHHYVGGSDYLALLYTFGTILLLLRFLKTYKKPEIQRKFLYILILFMMFAILQNQQPLKIVKFYFKGAKLNDAIAKRTLLIEEAKGVKAKSDTSMLYDKVIFIQGESANRDFLHIYGYPQNTTPLFSKLQEEGSLYAYDAIAPTNQTRYSVPAMLSDANVSNWYEGYSSSLSFITDFRQRGYKTYWITNQGMHGEHDDSITNIAMEADVQAFLASRSGDAFFDDVLVEYLQKKHKRNDAPELYVFHLSGSHFEYKKRYKKGHTLYETPQNIEEEYVNSIYFSDYVIGQILDYFQKEHQKILLVYISDHGEVVSEERSGHGYLPTFKEEYEIPFVIYSSIKNPRLDFLTKENKKHYFNSENLKSMVEYVAGLRTTPQLSFSPYIFSLAPENVFDYEKLSSYKHE